VLNDLTEFLMTAARPILIVEDDDQQRTLLIEALSLGNEFEVTAAATLNEADALLGAEDARFDAVLLDLGMPDGSGFDYLAKWRNQGHVMPIIIVTGSCDEAEVVRGLDAGANDYVTKPFRMNELLARLRTQVRIFEKSENATFTIGHYSFRPAAKLLVDREKRRLRLTSKEVEILRFLYRAGAKPVSRPILLEGVWGYNSRAETHTLETHIYRLRQKMEINPAACRILVTEGGGYQLNAA
jgi:DNA-binding response OmpR family regulator